MNIHSKIDFIKENRDVSKSPTKNSKKNLTLVFQRHASQQIIPRRTLKKGDLPDYIYQIRENNEKEREAQQQQSQEIKQKEEEDLYFFFLFSYAIESNDLKNLRSSLKQKWNQINFHYQKMTHHKDYKGGKRKKR